jgi:hypothetical protein
MPAEQLNGQARFAFAAAHPRVQYRPIGFRRKDGPDAQLREKSTRKIAVNTKKQAVGYADYHMIISMALDFAQLLENIHTAPAAAKIRSIITSISKFIVDT